MNENPYASPNLDATSPRHLPLQQSIRAPALILITISFAFIVFLCGSVLYNTWQIIAWFPKNRPPLVSAEATHFLDIPLLILLIGLHCVVIYGARSMLHLKNLEWAKTAAVISVIPCCSGFYILGIPFGIWALIVLNRPEVKAAFQEQSPKPPVA